MTVSFKFLCQGIERLPRRHRVEIPGVHESTIFDIRTLFDIGVFSVDRLDYLDNVQTILMRELPVTLIMARNGHHGPGAIAHHHEIRGKNRNRLAGNRVYGRDAERHTLLLHGLERRLSRFSHPAFFQE